MFRRKGSVVARSLCEFPSFNFRNTFNSVFEQGPRLSGASPQIAVQFGIFSVKIFAKFTIFLECPQTKDDVSSEK